MTSTSWMLARREHACSGLAMLAVIACRSPLPPKPQSAAESTDSTVTPT